MADGNERPQYQHGVGTIGGTRFHWGSGMPGKYWSIPYGDYPVTPNAPTGAWAHQAGAIPIANNVIPDPLLGRNRIGIMIHSGSAPSLDQLYTEGCFKVDPQDWPNVRSQILAQADKGPLYLHVAPGGVAAFTNTKTFSQAGDDTPAAAANATANTTAATQPSRPGTPTPIAGGNDHAAFIQNYAKQIGLDPNLALGIANAEGLRAWGTGNPNAASRVDIDPKTGQPFSFGDFQLNIHPGAMGSAALAANIDPRDPNQWQAADKFALDQMKAKGVSAWSGDPVAKAYLATGKVPALPAMPTTPGTTLNSPAVAASAPPAGSAAPAPATASGGWAGQLASALKPLSGDKGAAGGGGGGQADEPQPMRLPQAQPAQAIGGPMMMGPGGQNFEGRAVAAQNLAQQGFSMQPQLASAYGALGATRPPVPTMMPGQATGMPGLPGTTLNSPSQLQMALMSGSISPYDLYANAGMSGGGFGSM